MSIPGLYDSFLFYLLLESVLIGAFQSQHMVNISVDFFSLANFLFRFILWYKFTIPSIVNTGMYFVYNIQT